MENLAAEGSACMLCADAYRALEKYKESQKAALEAGGEWSGSELWLYSNPYSLPVSSHGSHGSQGTSEFPNHLIGRIL